MTDTQTFIDAIAAGDHDGRLDEIVLAVVERAKEGAVAFPWRLTLDGDTWTQESVTLGELKFAEGQCHVTEDLGGGMTRQRKATFREINPRSNAEHALALIIAHLYKAQQVPLADAIKRAEAITFTELNEMTDEYEVPGRPKGDGTSGPSTTS